MTISGRSCSIACRNSAANVVSPSSSGTYAPSIPIEVAETGGFVDRGANMLLRRRSGIAGPAYAEVDGERLPRVTGTLRTR
ncbi:MAG: hypothetical protein HOU81_16560 [Hamadaea sp.]|nr:hypothetical protein [Hamadaea sp.]